MYQMVHPTLLQSIAFRLWQIYLPKIVRQMWTIIFFTSWQCSSFVMGSDDWLSHVSDESQPKCEKAHLSHQKNEKLIFILRSTSDDWPSDPSNKSRLKCKKRPPKSSKNEMLGFGLGSTSDDQPSDRSNKI